MFFHSRKYIFFAKVIVKSIPSAWVKDFKLAKLYLETQIKDVMADLAVIEEQVTLTLN